ncbi:TonB-dependent receptor plug domain-containing protein [Paraglaciecola arctica]|uniref:TonB-dependent receptor plug domain-containing protein n=1 Tax=Paraglaciecola arctica TaxID=1128911 RepID=UPI001C07252A|nr:TonB-dependent receptor [Paraglaciecola arctica]MBU3004481.1 TonB-dependent receptor [Paraglaciecola arctica]
MKTQLVLTPLALLLCSLFPHYSYCQENADTQPDKVKTDSVKTDRIEVLHKRSNVMSEITENAAKLVAMPGTNGDPLQAVFALPGVVAAGGAVGSPAVRGSSPEDNLFEIDFMPAGYIFHDFGQSIFNRHLVQDFQLYSAGYGTSYSAATGAVFDVSLRNPKHQDIQTTIDFSLFNSGIFVEGQASENSAFYFSVRKSMLPLFFETGEELEDDDGEPSGYTINAAPDDNDYQGKWVWDINNNNMLSVSVTGAQDSAAINLNERADIALKIPDYQGDAEFTQKFNSQSIIWDHYSKNLHIKSGIGFLNDSERLELGKSDANPIGLFIDSEKEQISYKSRLNYQFAQSHHLIVDAAYYDVTETYAYDIFQQLCTDIDPDCDSDLGERVNDINEVDTSNQFVGITDVWTFSENWQTELGVQWQHNNYSEESFFLPRFSLSYFINDNSTITAKYGKYNRLQDIDYILPTLGNPDLKSQTATHTTLGFEQHLANEWSWSVETYYKKMQDLPLALDEAENDADLLYSNDVEGEAYGVDLLINKNLVDKWYGWLSLSYSKSERTNLREQQSFEYYADTPLVINMVLNYQLSEKWNLGFNFTARSGQPYTPIIGVRENPRAEGYFLPIYGQAYSERFDLAHRLDVRAEYKSSLWGLDATWVFEVMNIYGQENTSYIDLDYAKINSTDDLIIVEESDNFELRPSIGLSVTF